MEFETFKVTVLPIRLGQLLKLAEVVLDGNEAKFLIQSGQVLVNNEVETRRGKQLDVGDLVSVGERNIKLVAASN